MEGRLKAEQDRNKSCKTRPQQVLRSSQQKGGKGEQTRQVLRGPQQGSERAESATSANAEEPRKGIELTGDKLQQDKTLTDLPDKRDSIWRS